MKKAEEKEVQIHLPVDFVCSEQYMDHENIRVKLCNSKDGIDSELIGLDIGEKSIEKFRHVIKQGKTIVWNGPMGMFEVE